MSRLVRLLRSLLLDHHLRLKEKEQALTCLRHAIGHVPDEKERQELSWIWPKGEHRTPWTAAMEFFSLKETGINEDVLREYLASLSIAVRRGQHPNTAITGNVPIVGQLVALDETGFTDKLAEHLRPEFPNELAASLPGEDVPTARQVSVSQTKRKRSTEQGEGRAKLIAALTKHHQYAKGSCLNQEPIGNNELARMAKVSESTASAFFQEKFQGRAAYRALCQDFNGLIAALKLLNDEFSPHDLYGRKPADESDRDEDE
jgi:hypothetical protein